MAVQGQVISSYAAGVCSEYSRGGYHDWFLPAENQLNCLYTNQNVIGSFSQNNSYWTSTEVIYYTAVSQAFSNGMQSDAAKDSYFKVRCVRALTL